jgi:predicted transcriptional regulator
MPTPRIDAKTPQMRLNVPKMNELRRAHELESNVDLARLLGVDTATLHRVMKGTVAPSSSFIARVKLAFPSVSIDSLFYVDRLGETAGLVQIERPAAVA